MKLFPLRLRYRNLPNDANPGSKEPSFKALYDSASLRRSIMVVRAWVEY